MPPGVIRAESADQLLDAGIDVGAVESEDAGVAEGGEIGDRQAAIEVAVPAGELPAAADDARDLVAGRRDSIRCIGRCLMSSSGTAVVSAWLKRRLPVR